MPSIEAVIDFWVEQDVEWLHGYYIGWGEPFCFACDWLPPVKDGGRAAWVRAGSWLDRAHLQDHVVAGDDSPSNIVMLCHLCHDEMPEHDDREEAIEWVKVHPRRPEMWQKFTDYGMGTFGKVSRRTMFRLQAAYRGIVIENLLKMLEGTDMELSPGLLLETPRMVPESRTPQP